ncbi:hypothetical protein [Flavobacterium sp.]|uniref:hypothetical protein n=1 Tax=Flavobacterium sp. TaxID=239 RepID=UPI00286F1B7C|nr:hypothetical protein [Flavobacterium sp.]
MKKFVLTIVFVLLSFLSANAQQEKGIIGFNSWLNNWTEFKPNKTEYNEPNQIITGTISVDSKLYKKNVYLLLGNVYVTNKAKLTIEPGTVIIGDSESKAALIVAKGASIIAEGTETDPIIFTSNKSVRKAGDWGGILLLGDAPTNKFGSTSSVNLDLDVAFASFGGVNANSNSGILRYVRIEFAGAKVKGMGNFDALFLGGVGNQTVIDNVMISYSGGNSVAAFGGELNLNKLVSFKSSSNDFKFNYGTQVNIKNSLAIRASYLLSSSGSRCLYARSYDKKEEVDFTKKLTSVTATNLTFVNNSQNFKSDIEQGLVREAVYVAENASVDFKRSVISGFNPAVVLDEKISVNDESLKKLKFQEMYFNLCKGNIFVENNTNNEDLESWYGNASFFNVYSQGENIETFIDPFNDKRPDYRLNIGKITASKND